LYTVLFGRKRQVGCIKKEKEKKILSQNLAYARRGKEEGEKKIR
jgi:hypothetical protein